MFKLVNKRKYLERLERDRSDKVELEYRITKLEEEIERRAFPTGLVIKPDTEIAMLLQKPGAACMDGVRQLLLKHTFEHSLVAFDAESVGEKRTYAAGAGAGLEQLRQELEALLAEGNVEP